MKKIVRIIKIISAIVLIGLISSNLSMATSENLILRTDGNTIKIGQKFKLYVDLGNISVASYNYNIHFNKEIVEYISGPENTNVVDDRIISVWYDENGGKTPKVNRNIASFEFLAKGTGIANFNLEGEFFDSDGNEIDINNTNITINIENLDENIQNIQTQEVQGEKTNSLLKIMRLDKEGITPEFSPDIKEYYFIADMSVNSLNVTAIPENTNATTSITGNQNLKEGLNTILINVTSEDLSSTSQYKINVTKTDNKALANSNLEMLAIENVILEPIFDTNIFNYKANVSNDVEKLNILAIPENIQSTVEITGNEELKIGDNTIYVKVKAPNGYSYKNYEIVVHRRNQEEQITQEQEEENNAKKLSTLLYENENGQIESKEEENLNNEKNQNNIFKIIISIITVLIIIVIVVLILIKFKSTLKKE